MQNYTKAFTLLLFELTKNKYKINGFVSIKNRTDVFGHLIFLFNTFHFKNDYLKIYNDLQDNITLEDVKAQSDFCIYFRHVGNTKKRDIKFYMHNEHFVEMIFFTVGAEMTWEDEDNLWFLDADVIFNSKNVRIKGGFRCERTVKPEYAYLIE